MPSFDPERLTRIDDWMRSYVEESKFPGSTFLLAEGGNIVHRASTGYRAIDEGKPFEEDTIVRIYSMTKPVVSVGLMMLAERGLFHLDAPVSDFLPEFAECRALTGGAGDETAPCPAPTLHQLLTHTSGLTYAFNPGPAAAAYAAARIDFRPNGPGLAEMTRKLAELPLAFAPGTRWEYSVGIDVVGRVIEAVTGQPLDTWLEAEILEPLGMTDTGFAIPDNKVDRLATLYTSLESGAPISLAAAGKGVMRQVETAEDSAWRGAKTFSGGGGLLSTIDDYFAFTEMLRKAPITARDCSHRRRWLSCGAITSPATSPRWGRRASPKRRRPASASASAARSSSTRRSRARRGMSAISHGAASPRRYSGSTRPST